MQVYFMKAGQSTSMKEIGHMTPVGTSGQAGIKVFLVHAIFVSTLNTISGPVIFYCPSKKGEKDKNKDKDIIRAGSKKV